MTETNPHTMRPFRESSATRDLDRRAARVVIQHATSPDDRALLLAMLGLTPAVVVTSAPVGQDGCPRPDRSCPMTAQLPVVFRGRNGEPLDLREWEKRTHRAAYRQVEYTELSGASVSTEWAGICCDQDSDGRPLIFETVVVMMNGIHAPIGARMGDRYSTEWAAHIGHFRVVGEVLAYLADAGRAP